MLEFFRRYQRAFFFVITIVVITSFVFFGTFSTFMGEVERPDQQVGQTVEGSPIMLSEVQKLARFISTDREDGANRHGLLPNFCNDGVIRNDFLRTRLADVLVAEYFDALKEDFASRLEKAKRFHSYAHPEAAFLSAKAVWDQLLPSFNKEIASLQEEKEVSVAVFSHLTKLYEMQGRLPPETLRRILVYQHQQYPWLAIDQRLSYEDLALFGFHSISDWFGRDFIDLVAQFILNAAEVAERKGYRVSLEEAKGDLVHHFVESKEKILQGKADFNFHQHLRMLGFDERSAAALWQKVLLFRRYFQEVGETAFVDRLPYRDFAAYAEETATIRKYEWSLRLQTAQDLANYRLYVKAVCSKGTEQIPKSFLSVEDVEQKYPALVRSTYRAQVAEVTKKQLALRPSLKEVWAWETDEINWPRLQKEFALPEIKNSEERFKALQRLEPKKLAEIHAFAREQLVEENPQWAEEALAALPLKEKVWDVKGKEDPQLAQSGIYRRIENLEIIKKKHILSFAEAQTILTSLGEKVEGALAPEKNPFLKVVEEALTALKKNSHDPQWVQSGENSLWDQFKFQVKEEAIARNSQDNWIKQEAFMMLPNVWSPLHVAEGEIVFFYLQEKKSTPSPILEQLELGKETLASDAKRFVAEKLLQTIKKKKAIVIPVQREENESI